MSARALLALSLLVLPAAAYPQARDVGKVTFPASCDPKVQARFERGVAMLHSCWFGPARKTLAQR